MADCPCTGREKSLCVWTPFAVRRSVSVESRNDSASEQIALAPQYRVLAEGSYEGFGKSLGKALPWPHAPEASGSARMAFTERLDVRVSKLISQISMLTVKVFSGPRETTKSVQAKDSW